MCNTACLSAWHSNPKHPFQGNGAQPPNVGTREVNVAEQLFTLLTQLAIDLADGRFFRRRHEGCRHCCGVQKCMDIQGKVSQCVMIMTSTRVQPSSHLQVTRVRRTHTRVQSIQRVPVYFRVNLGWLICLPLPPATVSSTIQLCVADTTM